MGGNVPTPVSDSYYTATAASNLSGAIESQPRWTAQQARSPPSYGAQDTRDSKIDTGPAYAYTETDRLHDMEAFLSITNVAELLDAGEKCFDGYPHWAANLLFSSISN